MECYYRDEQTNAWLCSFAIDLCFSFARWSDEKVKSSFGKFLFFCLICVHTRWWLPNELVFSFYFNPSSRPRSQLLLWVWICKGFSCYQESNILERNRLHLMKLQDKMNRLKNCFSWFPIYCPESKNHTTVMRHANTVKTFVFLAQFYVFTIQSGSFCRLVY